MGVKQLRTAGLIFVKSFKKICANFTKNWTKMLGMLPVDQVTCLRGAKYFENKDIEDGETHN
jgi:hypothetical protein